MQTEIEIGNAAIDAEIEAPRSMFVNEIEADLRRAMLGAEQINDPMLTYLIQMALTHHESQGKSKAPAPNHYFFVD